RSSPARATTAELRQPNRRSLPGSSGFPRYDESSTTPLRMDATGAVFLFGAAATAGAINAVAGGGSLVSFPVAIAAGLTPIVANATTAVGLTPAALASAWGYRRELMSRDTAPPPLTVVRWMLIPMVLGGIVGALLLLWTPQRVFRHIVPLLVFAAT